MECVVPVATLFHEAYSPWGTNTGHLIPQIPGSQCSRCAGDSSRDCMPMTSDDIRWHPMTLSLKLGGFLTWLACPIDIESSKIMIWMNLAPLRHPFASHESSMPMAFSRAALTMIHLVEVYSHGLMSSAMTMMIGYECIILFYSIILWWLW